MLHPQHPLSQVIDSHIVKLLNIHVASAKVTEIVEKQLDQVINRMNIHLERFKMDSRYDLRTEGNPISHVIHREGYPKYAVQHTFQLGSSFGEKEEDFSSSLQIERISESGEIEETVSITIPICFNSDYECVMKHDEAAKFRHQIVMFIFAP